MHHGLPILFNQGTFGLPLHDFQNIGGLVNLLAFLGTVERKTNGGKKLNTTKKNKIKKRTA